MKYSFSLICLLFLLVACGGNAPKECETLTPFFNKDVRGVTNYKQEIGKQKCHESFFVLIGNLGMDIELFQSGCQVDDMSQEIRINLHPIEGEAINPPNASQCSKFVAEIFSNLADLDPVSLGELYEWGKAIYQKHKSFKYNEPTFVDDAQKLSVQIDQAKRGNYVQITVLIE